MPCDIPKTVPVIPKEEVNALRQADISLVAQRLGYFDVVRPKENAIDLVRRIRACDYGQAVAWLRQEIGPLAAGSPVTAARDPKRPRRPVENVITRLVARQTDALGCNRYRITLVPSDETKKPYLPGKPGGADSVEKFYSRNDIKGIVPWLLYRNNQGDNIFITPMDDHAFFILLDDVKVSEEELERLGFQPCLIQKTSWEGRQVVFKVPKDLDRDAVLSVFNELNRTLGDPTMTGLRHPFRMAGFRNRKPKHLRDGLYPFVEVIGAANRFCPRCADLVRNEMALAGGARLALR